MIIHKFYDSWGSLIPGLQRNYVCFDFGLEKNLPYIPDYMLDEKASYINLPFKNCYFEVILKDFPYVMTTSLLLFKEECDSESHVLYFYVFISGNLVALYWFDQYADEEIGYDLTDREICPYWDLHDDDIEEFGYEILDFILTALCILDCRNVETRIIRPPEKHNKKRIKSGKTPFFEYRTLLIRNNIRSVFPVSKAEKRNGPRFHLRRGHVRHYRGFSVWIQPTVVGDLKQGLIAKDYKIERGS
jgi:hypothetical protein